MKNDEQMYQSVLSRRNAYRERKKKSIRTIRRTVPVLACFCFVMVYGLELWDDLEKLPNAPISPNIIENQTIDPSESPTSSDIADMTESSSTDHENHSDTATTSIIPTQPETDVTSSAGSAQTVTTAVLDDAAERDNGQENIDNGEEDTPLVTTPTSSAQTVTAAALDDAAERDNGQENIDNGEEDTPHVTTPIPETMPITETQTTVPVIQTQPITEIQTTAPIQTTEETPQTTAEQTERNHSQPATEPKNPVIPNTYALMSLDGIDFWNTYELYNSEIDEENVLFYRPEYPAVDFDDNSNSLGFDSDTKIIPDWGTRYFYINEDEIAVEIGDEWFIFSRTISIDLQ